MNEELRTTQVDLAGLMEVLGRNLYSTPEVALRELVQNAHDSCTRRELEDSEPFEAGIWLRTDPSENRLVIEDSGAGLTREEIIEYLATVGRGYTGKLRRQGGPNSLIGAFGLGFLSAYFVSRKVEVRTCSYKQPGEGWLFASTGAERYHLTPWQPDRVGTSVTLHLNEDSRALCGVEHIRRLLRHYCGLLPQPIRVDDQEPINLAAPWRSEKRSPFPAEDLEFARQYEQAYQPLCTFRVGDSDSVSQGLLWVQDGWSYGTSDSRNLSVYVRGMLVSDDVRRLLPEWAGFLGGVIESQDLTPTASREDLQKDAVWEATSELLRHTVVEGISKLAQEGGGATWDRLLRCHGESLLGAALCDSGLFELLADLLRVPTSEGDLTLPAILKACRGKVYVSTSEQGGYEDVLFRAQGLPVVQGIRYGAYAFSKLFCQTRGAKLVQLGSKKGEEALFPPAHTPHQELFEELFSSPGRELHLTRFQPAQLPLALAPNREVLLKKRVDQTAPTMGKGLLRLVKMHTDTIEDRPTLKLYLNLDCPLVSRIPELEPSKAQALAGLLLGLGELMSARHTEGVEFEPSEALSRLESAVGALL